MKIGILGLGLMAEMMAATLVKMDDVDCYAVASRSLKKANSFKEKYNFKKAYGSYDELINDCEVDLVYIATPHSNHYEEMKQCLNAGKPVLCEKAFCTSAEQAKEIFELAKKKNLLVAEALWTRYLPSRRILQEVINSGIIGKPSVLNASLCYKISHIHRIVDPNLAGGALLDVGVYPLNFAIMAFGDDIESITAKATFTDTGVDKSNAVILTYKDGKVASLFSSMEGPSNRLGHIVCTEGYLQATNINNIEKIEVFDINHKLIKAYEIPAQISGYEYEIRACIQAIKEGKIECEEMPHADSLFMMEIYDEVRRQIDLKYPWEMVRKL